MVAFFCNCIDMLEKQFPYFREKKKNKAGKPPKIDIRHKQKIIRNTKFLQDKEANFSSSHGRCT